MNGSTESMGNDSRMEKTIPALTDLGDGVYLIDALYMRPNLAAIYLIVEEGRAAFFETGTNRSLSRVKAALDELKIAPEAVEYVIPSHVHLDHAGGAGGMMSLFPSARLVIHPRGTRHMVDPTRLIAGTIGVYGEAATRELYGTIIPIARHRIIEATDGMVLQLGSRAFTFLDTPGHAKHHVCMWDSRTRSVFTGDMFGLSYRELDVDGRASVILTTTPSQFDPDAMRRSIQRLVDIKPSCVFMTHYSRVGDVDRLGTELLRQLDEYVRIAQAASGIDESRRESAIASGLEAFFRQEWVRLEWRLDEVEFDRLLTPDLRLSAQGLDVWLRSSAPALAV